METKKLTDAETLDYLRRIKSLTDSLNNLNKNNNGLIDNTFIQISAYKKKLYHGGKRELYYELNSVESINNAVADFEKKVKDTETKPTGGSKFARLYKQQQLRLKKERENGK